MSINSRADRPIVDMGDGVRRRTMVWGDHMLLAEIHLDDGGTVPRHDHVYEQIGYCISGCVELSVGDETTIVSANTSWMIPGDTTHGARALEPSFMIEVWSPARDDYKD
jgi:quercetin dioxygenase-like cupin family protein